MIFPSSFYAIPAGGTLTTVKLVGRNADIDTASVPESVENVGRRVFDRDTPMP